MSTDIAAILADQAYATGVASVAQSAAETKAQDLVQAQISQLTASLTGTVSYDDTKAISLVGTQRVHWSGVYELTAPTPGGLAPLGSGDGSLSDQALLVSRVDGFAAKAGCNGGQGGVLRTVTTAADEPTGTFPGTLRKAIKDHQIAWEADQTARSWIIFDKSVANYNILLTAPLQVLSQNLTADGRGVQVVINAGGAPGQIPYGLVAAGGAVSGGTTVTLSSNNFGGARLKIGAVLDITDGTRTNVYATNRIVTAFDATAKTITFDASTPIPSGVPTGATVVLAGKTTGVKGYGVSLGGIDWNDMFGPGKVNQPAGNLIWHNIALISNYGGDILDTGSAQDFMLRNWVYGVWIDHCTFSNPDPFHDILFNVGRGAWGLTVSWCKFYDHYKAINHFGGVNGSGGLNPDGTNSPTHSFPPGFSVDNPGPYEFYDPKGKSSHGNELGLPWTIEMASWHHNLLDRLGQRAPKFDNKSLGHFWNNIVRHWGTKTDPLTANTITFPVPDDAPTGGAANQVINDAKLLAEYNIYEPFPAATGGALRAILRSANGSVSGCLRTVGNVYRGGANADTDINPASVPVFRELYPYTPDPVDALFEARIYLGAGAGAQSILWRYVGPVTIDGAGGTVAVKDEGTLLGSASTINITGAGATASFTGGTATVDIPGATGSALTVKDEGTSLSTAVTSIDITGAGVTATNVGGAVTVNVPGGGAAVVVPGQEIAYAGYWPSGAQTSATTTSTAQTDIAAAGVGATTPWGSDSVGAFTATRLDCTFTVPPNRIIDYEVSMYVKGSAAGTAIRVAVGDSSGTQIAGPQNSAVIANGTTQVRATTGRRRLDLSQISGGGPAAGTPFTIRPQWNINTGTATLDVGGVSGSISMRVFVGL